MRSRTFECIDPSTLKEKLRVNIRTVNFIKNVRGSVKRIVNGTDNRLIVIIGPCSIHDIESTMDYCYRLSKIRTQLQQDLEVIMRAFLEKPRTSVGWKGLLNDPYLDGSSAIDNGLEASRKLYLQINKANVPIGAECLNPIAVWFIHDLIAWGAIGARTTESQVHREIASGLPFTVGFKNNTEGAISTAINSITAAANPHYFLSVNNVGKASIIATDGNSSCHLILRGGHKVTNYDSQSVSNASTYLKQTGLKNKVLIDVSHANSKSNHVEQARVCKEIIKQISNGERRLLGIMMESYLTEGKQTSDSDSVCECGCGCGCKARYGKSITDACIGWVDSVDMFKELASAIRIRRKVSR